MLSTSRIASTTVLTSRRRRQFPRAAPRDGKSTRELRVHRPTTGGKGLYAARAMIMTARASSDHNLSRCSRRAPSGTVLAVLLLCLAALAGCGASGEPPVQRVAYCQGPMSDHPSGDLVEVQFRQGTTPSAGSALIRQVPRLCVDG